MPKFLDAPSWYDLSGTTNWTLHGPQNVPTSGNQDCYAVPSVSLPGSVLYYSYNGGTAWFPPGAVGAVLSIMQAGTGGPLTLQWNTPKYIHYIRLFSAYMSSVYCDISFVFISDRSSSYTSISLIASDMATIVEGSGGVSRSAPGVPAYGMIDYEGTPYTNVTGGGINNGGDLCCAIPSTVGNISLDIVPFSEGVTRYINIYDSAISTI